jgi:hypothetical protein
MDVGRLISCGFFVLLAVSDFLMMLYYLGALVLPNKRSENSATLAGEYLKRGMTMVIYAVVSTCVTWPKIFTYCAIIQASIAFLTLWLVWVSRGNEAEKKENIHDGIMDVICWTALACILAAWLGV